VPAGGRAAGAGVVESTSPSRSAAAEIVWPSPVGASVSCDPHPPLPADAAQAGWLGERVPLPASVSVGPSTDTRGCHITAARLLGCALARRLLANAAAARPASLAKLERGLTLRRHPPAGSLGQGARGSRLPLIAARGRDAPMGCRAGSSCICCVLTSPLPRRWKWTAVTVARTAFAGVSGSLWVWLI
jgi:hypothetical protein